jgi:hypothetical protein
MGYDDLKDHNGKKYMGMPVGGSHEWSYPNGRWRERKVAPDRWNFVFESVKRREESAPANSGAPLNTQYHWCILADQRVRKVDKDAYETFMEGLKFKVAHKRPHWLKWSTEYPNNISDRDKTLSILEEVAEKLRYCAERDYKNLASSFR